MTTKHYIFAAPIEMFSEFNTPPSPQPVPVPQPPPNGQVQLPAPPLPEPIPTAPSQVKPEPVFSAADIERARKEEKEKLYKAIEEHKSEAAAARAKQQQLESQLKELNDRVAAQARAQLPPDQQAQAEIADLRSKISKMESDARNATAAAEARAQQAEVEAYKERRIRQLKEEGVGFVDYLITGSSPAQIEENIAIAKAEYEHQRNRFYQDFTKSPEYQNLAAAAARAQQVQQTTPEQQVQQAFPQQHQQPVQGPTLTAPAPTPQGQGFDPNFIQQVTTPEAIRSGAYAQNREAILARMRQGVPVGSVTLPMRPFPGMQPAPAPQPMVPQGSPMPYQQMPGGVMQPMGLPTPPVVNPNMPAHASMAMPSVQYAPYPQQGQPQGFAPPAVPYPQAAPPGAYPQQYVQQPQYAPQQGYPQQGYPQQYVPQGYPQQQFQQVPQAPMDPAAMKAAAAESAARALQNPNAAIQASAPTGGVPRVPGDYNHANANPQVQPPTAQQLAHGHPMIRNN